jgi:hypothetical protein
MATVIFNNPTILFDELDITAAQSAVAVAAGAEAQDDTVFGDDTRSNKGGLKTVELSGEGFYNANTSLDNKFFVNTGGAGVPVTIVPEAIAVGGVSYFINASNSQYTPYQGSVGDLLKFSFTAMARKSNLIQGQVEYTNTAIASGNSTGDQIGAITSAQKMYAVVHCTSGTGTLDIDVESDDNSGFTSAVTRGSFTQLTAAGSELISISGPVTDDYWRINFTIGGGSPSFTFVVSLGIGD